MLIGEYVPHHAHPAVPPDHLDFGVFSAEHVPGLVQEVFRKSVDCKLLCHFKFPVLSSLAVLVYNKSFRILNLVEQVRHASGRLEMIPFLYGVQENPVRAHGDVTVKPESIILYVIDDGLSLSGVVPDAETLVLISFACGEFVVCHLSAP